MLVTTIIFLLVLSLLVYVHEFGHFLLAKLNGVKVWEFAFGFRPRLFAKKIGETLFTINALPLGGFVKLHGEDPSETGPDSFRSKSIFQRFQILVAGVVMNLILGWLILTILFAVGFDPIMPGITTNPFVKTGQQIEIISIAEQSPAASAGLQAGDRVVEINDQGISNDFEFITRINSLKGQSVRLDYLRAGQPSSTEVVPRTNPPAGEGALGVQIRAVGKVQTSVVTAPLAAVYETGRIIALSVQGFGNFVGGLIFDQKVSDDVTGLIGVGAMTGVVRRLGLQYLAQLVVVISIGLAVINLVPILPLDGGHIAALGYEKVARKPLSEKQQGVLAAIGLSLVMLLFVIVTYKDLIRFQVLDRLF